MKQYLFFFLVVALTAFTISCGDGENKVSVSPQEVTEKVAKENLVIIDVRTPEEFSAGHMPGARLIDVLNPSFVSEINKLDKEQGYLVYCKSGSRSADALEIMKDNGFSRVYHMEGGFDAWKGQVEK